MRCRGTRGAWVVVVVLMLTSLAIGPTWARASQDKMADGTPEYIIGPEDLLHIVVWKNEALTRTVQVRPDGMISLPLLNDVKAAGLTAMQLRDVLIKRFVEYMPSPEISVIVQEVRSFKVSVLGQVSRPGRYDLRSRTTVLEALALAGGFRDFASPSRIVVLRLDGKGMKRIPFNYNQVISGSSDQQNFELQPNDVILVP